MIKWMSNGVEFSVGDKVKVVRKVCERTEGAWDNAWVDDMDLSVGEVFTISEISHDGVVFEECCYSYPLSCLEKVTPTVSLPQGDFGLIGRDGVKYQVVRPHSTKARPVVRWVFKALEGCEACAYVSEESTLKAIESGFWVLAETQAAKRARLEELEDAQTVLTNEIEQLEKELAQW